MGSRNLRSVVPEFITEKSCFFIREPDGTYSKIEKLHIRNTRTYSLEEDEEKQSHLRYRLVTTEDYDEVMSVQDPRGNDVILKFKLIVPD